MKRTPLRQQSKRKRAEAGARRRLVARVTERDRSCRAALLVAEIACNGPLDVHELIQRSLWAAGYLVDENCLLVCRAHHTWIDDNIARAHELGLLKHSWER